jgi:hypothetical protein
MASEEIKAAIQNIGIKIRELRNLGYRVEPLVNTV